MKTEQIYKNLDEMLANPAKRNFLNHLVRAYALYTNVSEVYEKPKNGFKCVITGDDLFTVNEFLESVRTDEEKAEVMDKVKSLFLDAGENTVSRLVENRKLGFTGSKTTTYISYGGYSAFISWLLKKSLEDDKHIGWLMRSIKKENKVPTKSPLDKADQTSSGTTTTVGVESPERKKLEVIKKYKNVPSTYSLGEMDAFKKILVNLKD